MITNWQATSLQSLKKWPYLEEVSCGHTVPKSNPGHKHLTDKFSSWLPTLNIHETYEELCRKSDSWGKKFFHPCQELFLFVAPCEGQICANVCLTLNYSRASDCRGLNSKWISRFLLPRFSATSCPSYLLSVETQPVVLRLLGVGYPSHRFTLNLQHSAVPATAQCPQLVKNANFPPNKFSPADFAPVSLLTVS